MQILQEQNICPPIHGHNRNVVLALCAIPPIHGHNKTIIGLETIAVLNHLKKNNKKLAVVGLGPNPDVFDQPFHSLNFSMSKELGRENQSKLTFGITNLLDDKVESYYESFGSRDKVFSAYAPGRTFNLSYSYNF